jgi:hypothetical protein
MHLQLNVERRDHPADEGRVPVSREGRVAEQQQPMVALPDRDQPPMAPHEIGDVVGDERPTFELGVLQDREVVNATQVTELRLLQGHDLVTVPPQLDSNESGDHLVQEQPHPSNDRSTS